LIASTTGTTYIDAESGLVGGSAAYFVVTAVDSTGAESSYSSEARALIPTS
jgi:fibronectin type 3 domain-containing protein